MSASAYNPPPEGPPVLPNGTRRRRPDAEAASISIIGVNFRTAPVSVRESLSFSPDAIREFLIQFAGDHPEVELLLLSTCNRTEFLLAQPEGADNIDRLLGALTRFRPDAHILHSDCHRYHLEDEDAINHLMRVACGLDSAILGDQQILGQIKAAKAIAGQSGSLGIFLENLLLHVMRAAKRSRRETAIGRGAASIGAAIRETIETSEETSPRTRERPRTLVIGAGDTARDIGRHLAKDSNREIIFLNRTLERAQALAEDCGGQAVAWIAIDAQLARADFVVTATSCPRPIITQKLFAGLPVDRRPRLVIDAGVPRNVAPGLPVDIINIDSIHRQQEAAWQLRRAAIPQVESIINAETGNWRQWLRRRPIERHIKNLFAVALGPYVAPDTPLNRETRRLLPAATRRELGIRARQLRCGALPFSV